VTDPCPRCGSDDYEYLDYGGCSKCRPHEEREREDQDDPLAGLPPDLVRVLRDPSIVIPQDQGVFELIAKMTHAPTATASAMTNEQWMKAWVSEWQRANRAEVALEELRAANEARDSQMKKGTS
jgi:hypothetical protein